jgi:hypothetical protein
MKHDTEANWTAAGTATKPFIPKEGEIIVYDYTDGRRMKIGDGKTAVHLLPFSINNAGSNTTPVYIEDGVAKAVEGVLFSHTDVENNEYFMSHLWGKQLTFVNVATPANQMTMSPELIFLQKNSNNGL